MPAPQAALRGALLATAAGVLHGLCFAPADLWFLAVVAPAPLILAARSAPAPLAAGYGWLTGTVAASIAVTPWMTVATLDYFRQGPLGAVAFATLVGQVFHALPTALFALGVHRLERLRRPAARILAIAGWWTGLELLRARAFTGAPWDLLGHALHDQPLWIQTADLGGVFVVSFGCVALAACVAEATRAPLPAAATALALLVPWLGYGTMRLRHEHDGGAALRLALIQGAVPNAWRSDPARAAESFAAFADATQPTLAARPALVVWSENAVSFLLEPNARFRDAVARLLGPEGPLLLVGGPRWVQPEPGRAEFFNAAYLLDQTGSTVAAYDKRRLVPFAEYAPLPGIPALGWRFDAPGDYTPGAAATVFPHPAPFGVLICFEAIYPDLARHLVAGGAEMLVNISNDAWFGSGAGLAQHFAITVFRAVEFRRTLARATNTGITALVGPSGRVLARFPIDRRGGVTVDAPLRDEVTWYARLGDAFGMMAFGGALAAIVAAGRR